MARWIDAMYGSEMSRVGAVGYLVHALNTSNGRETLSLRERPLRTNGSGKARLRGWCGETDNISKTAQGVWRVVRMNKACDRCQVVELTGADLAEFLATDGHPELMPPEMARAWDHGDVDGHNNVCDVQTEQGDDAVIASLRPGAESWDTAARNAQAAAVSGIPAELHEVYYRAYERAARALATEIRDEQKSAA